MAQRKSLLNPAPERPELDRLLKLAMEHPVTEEQLEEQRVSFAYGNAPFSADRITKETVRAASKSVRIVHE
jgi:predicted GNAT superfamily acetyltransferase